MMRYWPWQNRNIDTVYLKKEKNTMKYLKKHLSLALALVLCLSLAACGKSSEDYVESNEDYGDDGSDYNLYGCLLYTSPSPRDPKTSRMPSSA